jgi:hypothetical protein
LKRKYLAEMCNALGGLSPPKAGGLGLRPGMTLKKIEEEVCAFGETFGEESGRNGIEGDQSYWT